MSTEADSIKLATMRGMQYVDLDKVPKIPEETLELLRIEVATRHRAIPISLAGNAVTVAIDDPADEDNMRLIEQMLAPREVLFYVATEAAMSRALKQRYSDKLLDSRA